MDKSQLLELMRKRHFTNIMILDSKIYSFCPMDLEKKPSIGVEVNIESEDFRFIYRSKYSLNILSTPWCGPVTKAEHFRKIYKGMLQWARKIEELYKEE